ncbi:MAG TPA: hypothetical protein VFJ51_13280 [Nitrososphaeraceae archaeon]|nr:hypothetical protein [Nitrososphaeraceae archaeon]
MSKDLYNDPFKDPIVGRIIAKESLGGELMRQQIESEEVLNKLYNKRYNIFSS